ncbi:flagellar basal-body MS-ring/collar protein FliF [Paenibacillus gorillae]|uniref:flagellar basal-body MS-ring/collar protein FliF n=1 Tax=Paenibacillus gorillae TaxID=1243662 RepID=UPI0005A9B0EA|nr:flagellar basal-body MS-ring/collar protein FliF [Paenibacillus gorillae]
MNERFAQARQRLTQFWGQMGKKQKIWLGASIGVLVLSIILLTYIFTRTDYEVAFTNLDATDSAAVMNYLDSGGITYQLSPNGKSISVPSAVASRVKVDVGSQGLVKNGSMGFGAFSEGSSTFGTTDNEFNVKYLNALNGEVQQLLNGMQGVESSKVLVNLPEETVFLTPEDKDQASASIMMNFTAGYRPSQKEIDGYYNLVKTAIPKLAIENITITSPQGELLSSATNGIAAGATEAAETQFQIQRKYESELKKNIQQFLGPLLGDNLVISVASSFNFDKKKSEEQLVKPLENNNNNGIIISEETNTNSSTNGNSQAGGVAGTGETDVPGYNAAQGSGNSESEQSSRITNYDVNRINNLIESAPYQIKDLSISIGVEEGKLNEQSLASVTSYLTSVVRAQLANSGQDVNDDLLIGKKVAVISQNFAVNGGNNSVSGLSTGWAIGIGAAALAIIGALAVMLVRRRRKNAAQEELVADEPIKVEYPSLDMDVSQESQARKNLETLAKRKPEEFVNLLRSWLVEE